MLCGPRSLSRVLLVAVLSLCGCGDRSDPELSELSLFESRYLFGLLEFQPFLGVQQGIQQYEGRAVTFTPLIVARRIDRLKINLAQVIALRERQLSADEALRARWIDYRIRAELLDLEVLETWRRDPQVYFRIPFESIDFLMNEAAGAASERLRSIQIHLNELEGMMANMRGNLDQVSEPARQRSIELGASLRRMLETDLPEWGLQAAGVDVRLRDSFQIALDRAVRGLDLGLEWLETSTTRAAETEAALGPEGLVMKLLFDEMIAIPLDELTALVEEGLDRDQVAFLEQARLVDPNQTPSQILGSFGGSAVSSEEIAAELRRYVDQARAFAIDRGIAPAQEYSSIEVVEAPEYVRRPLSEIWLGPVLPAQAALEQESPDQAPGAAPSIARLYFTPPRAGQADGFEAARFDGPALMLSAAREVIPGRYLMAVHAAVPRESVQRMLISRGAKEGWAAYAEELLVEEGFGADDPRVRLVHIWRNLISDCRALAAVRLHAGGATLEEATAIFVEQAYLPEAWAKLEARHALLDPSGSTEMLAKHEILDLREQYRILRGEAFRLDEFHADYLALGPIPVALARERLLGPE